MVAFLVDNSGVTWRVEYKLGFIYNCFYFQNEYMKRALSFVSRVCETLDYVFHLVSKDFKAVAIESSALIIFYFNNISCFRIICLSAIIT
jgi:hypothetical protein